MAVARHHRLQEQGAYNLRVELEGDWGRVKGVFVSFPFSADPAANISRVAAIARSIAVAGNLPIAPHIFLPVFLDERSERSLALRLCLELVARCDELRVYAKPTDGMRLEIAEAHRLGIPVIDGMTGERLLPKEEPPR